MLKEPGERPGSLFLSLRLFFLLAASPLLPEALNTTCSVDQLLTSREVRVANRADIEVNVLLRATCLELMTAGAVNSRRYVLGVNAFLHISS